MLYIVNTKYFLNKNFLYKNIYVSQIIIPFLFDPDERSVHAGPVSPSTLTPTTYNGHLPIHCVKGFSIAVQTVPVSQFQFAYLQSVFFRSPVSQVKNYKI